MVAQCPGNEHTKGYSPGSAGASNVTTVDSPAFSSREATRTFGESGTKPRSCAFGSFSEPNSSFSYSATVPRLKMTMLCGMSSVLFRVISTR